ncbi:MAG: divalent-cation tolerance protein CutA [Halobacteriales archaeon]
MPTAYVTAPRDVAADLARLLVEERLAACVNVVDCASTYRWADEVHEDDEAVLFAKTTAAAYDRLEARIVEEHPYDVPAIERFDEADELAAFAEWRDGAVGEGGS